MEKEAKILIDTTTIKKQELENKKDLIDKNINDFNFMFDLSSKLSSSQSFFKKYLDNYKDGLKTKKRDLYKKRNKYNKKINKKLEKLIKYNSYLENIEILKNSKRMDKKIINVKEFQYLYDISPDRQFTLRKRPKHQLPFIQIKTNGKIQYNIQNVEKWLENYANNS